MNYERLQQTRIPDLAPIGSFMVLTNGLSRQRFTATVKGRTYNRQTQPRHQRALCRLY